MSYDEASDAPGVMQEQVVIDLGPEQLPALETIVDPVLVAELPTVLWCPHGHESSDPRPARADRRDAARHR